MSGSRAVIQITHATLLVSALAALTMPHAVNAQAYEMPGTIEGVVLDRATRQAVASAKVTATVNGRTALTDAEGRFKLDAVAGGLVDLTVRAASYTDLTEKGGLRAPWRGDHYHPRTRPAFARLRNGSA